MVVVFIVFFLMIRRPPRSTRTDTLFPYTTLFRSYAMNSHNAKAFEKLTKQFNRSQDGVRVTLIGFDDEQAVESALNAGLKKKDPGPNLVQLPDARSPNGAPGRHYLLPMHSLLAKYRSEEHTSELQSLMRISYAVFCLKK